MNHLPSRLLKYQKGHFKFFRKFAVIFKSRYQWHRGYIGHLYRWCRWCWWQIMGTFFRLLTPQRELEEKNWSYVNSSTQRCPNKLFKTFLTKDFCHLPLVSSELQISLRIFLKNSNRSWENWFMKKTWSKKSRGTVPLWLLVKLPPFEQKSQLSFFSFNLTNTPYVVVHERVEYIPGGRVRFPQEEGA
jgi:hypothetical protein